MAPTLKTPWHLPVVLLIPLSAAAQVRSEVFTASSDLSGAFRLERQVVSVLEQLLNQSEMKLNSIRQ